MSSTKGVSELQTHLDFISENKDELIKTCVLSIAAFWAMAFNVHRVADFVCKLIVSRNPNSSAKIYLNSSSDKKWNYIQAHQSTLFAIATFAYCWYTIVSCDPPAEERIDDGLLGNTLFRNNYCKTQMSLSQIKLIVIFMSYMLYDISLLLFTMNEFPSSVMEAFYHHSVSLYGSIVGIYCGRFLGVVCASTILTEFSTPFVNNRWLLKFHEKADGSAYFWNGWAMTISFFIFRIVY